jgi:hypothetical protein
MVNRRNEDNSNSDVILMILCDKNADHERIINSYIPISKGKSMTLEETI